MATTTREQQEQVAREALEAMEGPRRPVIYGCRVCGDGSYEPTCDRCRSSNLPAGPILLIALTMATMTTMTTGSR